MNSNTIYLEVDKTNQAILSYFLEQPTSSSSKFDYVQATQDELTFLNALEDTVFPPGVVATLSDLQAHRARVQAVKKAQATNLATVKSKTSQQPPKPFNTSLATNAPTNSDNARASLKATMRKNRSSK